MSGWIILGCNVGAVAVGALLGCLFKKRVSQGMQEKFMDFFAVISLGLGIRMLDKTANFTAVVFAFLLGGLVGHWLRIDSRVKSLAGLVNRGEDNSGAAGTLLVAFTLFCTSTSGIQGALELGFSGETSLLTTKAIMDFLTALFFAAGAGWTIALVAIPQGIILAGLYLLSGLISPHVTEEMLGNFSGCGGLMQFLNSLRMTKLKDPPVLDLSPCLILVFPITWLFSAL